MGSRIRSIDCQGCGEKHFTQKAFLFRCPNCRVYLPDGIKLHLAFIMTSLALLSINLIFALFPPQMIEESTLWSMSIIKSGADRVTRLGDWVGVSLEEAEDDVMLFVSSDPDKAINSQLFLFVLLVMLGLASRFYRFSTIPILRSLGWMYEKQTNSWIASERNHRTEIGKLFHEAYTQQPHKVLNRLWGVLLVVPFLIFLYLMALIDTEHDNLRFIPLLSLLWVPIIGVSSGYFGYEDVEQNIISGFLMMILPSWLVVSLGAFMTDLLPIFDENVWEKLIKFSSWTAMPLIFQLLHFPVFASSARIGALYRQYPEFPLSTLIETGFKGRRGVKRFQQQHPPSVTPTLMDRYSRAKSNLEEAKEELEHAYKFRESSLEPAREIRLYELARQEVEEIQAELDKRPWMYTPHFLKAYLRGFHYFQPLKYLNLVLDRLDVMSNITLWMTGLWMIILPRRLLKYLRNAPFLEPVRAFGRWNMKKILSILLFLLPGLLFYWSYSHPSPELINRVEQVVPSGIADQDIPENKRVDPDELLAPLAGFRYIPEISIPIENLSDEVRVSSHVVDSQGNNLANIRVRVKEQNTDTLIDLGKTDENGEASTVFSLKSSEPILLAFYDIVLEPNSLWSKSGFYQLEPENYIWVKVYRKEEFLVTVVIYYDPDEYQADGDQEK